MLNSNDAISPPSHSELVATHTPERIRQRLEQETEHGYLRDFVYGAIDGTVTTFAVVSGVAGAGLSPGVVIVLGMANLLGDGFSMAASNYLGTKADEGLRKKARRIEEQHIAHYPEGEREEIRQIFANKGFAEQQLEEIVEVITADKQRWVDTMIVEEHGMPLAGPSALRAAITTLIAFVAIGLIPLVAFIYNYLAPVPLANAYLVSTLLTGVAFFLVGAAKSRFVDESWYRAGLETLFIGGIAAALAYGAGVCFSGIVDGG